MPFSAAKWLDHMLTRDSRVFEYGSGGSTLFFADRVGELVSVEHDEEWHRHMATVLSGHAAGNSTYLFRPPERADEPADCKVCDVSHASEREEYSGCTFDAYVSAIDDYEDGSFDLVSVDGRARPACIAHALPKLKPGGFILLDDTHRGHYHERILLSEKDAKRFRGIRPYSSYVCETMVWRVNGNGNGGSRGNGAH